MLNITILVCSISQYHFIEDSYLYDGFWKTVKHYMISDDMLSAHRASHDASVIDIEIYWVTQLGSCDQVSIEMRCSVITTYLSRILHWVVLWYAVYVMRAGIVLFGIVCACIQWYCTITDPIVHTVDYCIRSRCWCDMLYYVALCGLTTYVEALCVLFCHTLV